MSTRRNFRQKLSLVTRYRVDEDFDRALVVLGEMIQSWPGNAHLHALRAEIIQLHEDPNLSLEEARLELVLAMELEREPVASAIELGHFQDSVEDNSAAALKCYAEGVANAKMFLLDGLIGQVKAFLQLDKRFEARRSLLEALQLIEGGVALRGRSSCEIDELVGEVFAVEAATR